MTIKRTKLEKYVIYRIVNGTRFIICDGWNYIREFWSESEAERWINEYSKANNTVIEYEIVLKN